MFSWDVSVVALASACRSPQDVPGKRRLHERPLHTSRMFLPCLALSRGHEQQAPFRHALDDWTLFGCCCSDPAASADPEHGRTGCCPYEPLHRSVGTESYIKWRPHVACSARDHLQRVDLRRTP